MDRQLSSPLIFQTLSPPTKLTPAQTFSHLQSFLPNLASSPSRTQLERLTDALGVEIGLILPAEGERREAERLAERARVKAEKKRVKEEEKRRLEMEDVEGVVEGLEDDQEGEEGAVEFEGEEKMDDRGDVEYGEPAEDEEDEDEPDNADKMEDLDKMEE